MDFRDTDQASDYGHGHWRGAVINPKTARSQLIGGIVFGIGMALLEGSHLEEKTGRMRMAILRIRASRAVVRTEFITRAVSKAEPEVGLGVLNQRQFMNIKIIEPIGQSEAAIKSRLRDLLQTGGHRLSSATHGD
jgi:hypothetical protein